jgi:hypothetical protein
VEWRTRSAKGIYLQMFLNQIGWLDTGSAYWKRLAMVGLDKYVVYGD